MVTMKNIVFILFILAVIIMSLNIITAIGTKIIDNGSATLTTGFNNDITSKFCKFS